jgi:hypothetical protein
MIRLQQGVTVQGWWISAYDNLNVEPPSKQVGMHIFDLEEVLPRLIYERYCLLKLASSNEWVSGVGNVIRYNNGTCQFFIYEEE